MHIESLVRSLTMRGLQLRWGAVGMELLGARMHRMTIEEVGFKKAAVGANNFFKSIY